MEKFQLPVAARGLEDPWLVFAEGEIAIVKGQFIAANEKPLR